MSTLIMTLLKLIFNSIGKELAYSPSWFDEDNGYYGFQVHKVPLAPGELAKAIDDQGRLLVFIGTEYGTVLLFQLWGCEETTPVCVNMPMPIANKLKMCSSLTADTIRLFIKPDNVVDNIGRKYQKIESMKPTFVDSQWPDLADLLAGDIAVRQQALF